MIISATASSGKQLAVQSKTTSLSQDETDAYLGCTDILD